MRWFAPAPLLSSLLSVALLTGSPRALRADDRRSGLVAALTNAIQNAVAVFDRHTDGSISPRSLVFTGGAGTGSDLGSQGALTLSDDGEWLLAVNAGSNEITAFAATPFGLFRTA